MRWYSFLMIFKVFIGRGILMRVQRYKTKPNNVRYIVTFLLLLRSFYEEAPFPYYADYPLLACLRTEKAVGVPLLGGFFGHFARQSDERAGRNDASGTERGVYDFAGNGAPDAPLV